jgi:LCP family protein required for cell wall assembly
MARNGESESPDLFDRDVDYPQPFHAAYQRLGGWKLISALALSLVAVFVVGAGTVFGITLHSLQSNLSTVELPNAKTPVLPGIGDIEGGFNVLIVGSDTRVDQGPGFDFVDSELNDVTILVHVSENHDRAVVMSLPRDLLVDVPACVLEDGTLSAERTMQPLNTTMGIGGLPCVALTVEKLTGLDIGYAGLLTFVGVAQLSLAVGGVEVCVTAPLIDPHSGINLQEAGYHTLEGGEALAFLRTRKGVGDGSDLSRISSQQVFMSALIRTLRQDEVLNDLGKLYGIAYVASESMVLSTSLASVDVMVAMARALRGIPNENILFIQYPVLDANPETFPGKVIPHPVLAETLVERLIADEPFVLSADSLGLGSTVPAGEADIPSDPSGENNPPKPANGGDVVEGLVGQSAGDETCAVPR